MKKERKFPLRSAVMVTVEDEKVRNNRLALMAQL
jgi:glycyl-tRNA synthetase beta subunit